MAESPKIPLDKLRRAKFAVEDAKNAVLADDAKIVADIAVVETKVADRVTETNLEHSKVVIEEHLRKLQKEHSELKSNIRDAMALMTNALGNYLAAPNKEARDRARDALVKAAEAFEKVEAFLEK